MIAIEEILVIAAILLLLGVVASKASSKLGIPALLLFLLIGMLAGSEGPGRIPFDDASLAQSVGIVALAFILFAGGLDTHWQSVSRIIWQGLSLATVGVLITAVLMGWFATVILGLPWLQGLLLGSIVSSTDAAAVFSVLRSKNIALKGRIQPLLEFESGSNDPMAVFLTLGLISLLIHPAESSVELIPMFFRQMLIGAALGYGLGKLAVLLINWLKLDGEGLYSALTVSIVLLTYGATASLGGSGFLAVYLAGIVMGNSDFVHRRSLTRFHDGLAWLMQIAMFLVLGLLVFPSRLLPVMGAAVLMALFLVVVARPLSVFASLAFARVGLRQKVLISWTGLRGSVPIILATFPLPAGTPNADLYFPIVFFIVLISVLLQGTTIQWVARKLGLQRPSPEKDRRFPLDILPAGENKSQLAEITIPEYSSAAGRRVVDMHLPRSVHVMLITRGNDYLVPRGSTTLKAGDVLQVLGDPEALIEVRLLVSRLKGAPKFKS
jgi:cell volume regulation protein A